MFTRYTMFGGCSILGICDLERLLRAFVRLTIFVIRVLRNVGHQDCVYGMAVHSRSRVNI